MRHEACLAHAVDQEREREREASGCDAVSLQLHTFRHTRAYIKTHQQARKAIAREGPPSCRPFTNCDLKNRNGLMSCCLLFVAQRSVHYQIFVYGVDPCSWDIKFHHVHTFRFEKT